MISLDLVDLMSISSQIKLITSDIKFSDMSFYFSTTDGDKEATVTELAKLMCEENKNELETFNVL